MIVVSDSSPLITLARIGRLTILASLYESILITQSFPQNLALFAMSVTGWLKIDLWR